jgi:hypothetical protein
MTLVGALGLIGSVVALMLPPPVRQRTEGSAAAPVSAP